MSDLLDTEEHYSEALLQDWLQNRVEMFGKKINTTGSVKSIRKKLDEWYWTGYNTNAIIQHAIEVGWRGIFLPAGMEPKRKQKIAHSLGNLLDNVVKPIPYAGPTNRGRKAAQALKDVLEGRK